MLFGTLVAHDILSNIMLSPKCAHCLALERNFTVYWDAGCEGPILERAPDLIPGPSPREIALWNLGTAGTSSIGGANIFWGRDLPASRVFTINPSQQSQQVPFPPSVMQCIYTWRRENWRDIRFSQCPRSSRWACHPCFDVSRLTDPTTASKMLAILLASGEAS